MPNEPEILVAPAGKKPARRRTDGRDLILQAAEQLFAEHGFDGCSLRSVAERAQVNQGMIHYFFKSKESLFLETYMRCGRPLVEERLRLLDAEEQQWGAAPIPVARLIEIFLMPAVHVAAQGASGRSFLRMQAQLQLDASEFSQRLRRELYDASSRRFVQALQRSLPALTLQEVGWRFVFMLGTYQYALANTGRLEAITAGTSTGANLQEAVRQMIPFLVAGLSASPPAPAA